jgi:hypothetical protein
MISSILVLVSRILSWVPNHDVLPLNSHCGKKRLNKIDQFNSTCLDVCLRTGTAKSVRSEETEWTKGCNDVRDLESWDREGSSPANTLAWSFDFLEAGLRWSHLIVLYCTVGTGISVHYFRKVFVNSDNLFWAQVTFFLGRDDCANFSDCVWSKYLNEPSTVPCGSWMRSSNNFSRRNGSHTRACW